MNLIELDYIKKNFPQWDQYAEFDQVSDSLDDALKLQLELAETELSGYITVTAEQMTPALKLDLLRIVKKNLFDLKHTDSEFDRPPQIITDYKNTIKRLQLILEGVNPVHPPSPDKAQQGIKITAKKRRYKNWFRDNGGYQTTNREE